MRSAIRYFSGPLLGACATLPQGYDRLRWADRRGDRGVGMAQRDLEGGVCAVETRRSDVGQCMAARGWLRTP